MDKCYYSEYLIQIQELLKAPQLFIEKEFSPYFYYYFNRYKNPYKWQGYLELCKYLFHTTGAKDAHVLDLGCGFGLMAILLAINGAKEVVGYDLNTEKINLFRKMLFYIMGTEVKNIKPILGDSSKIEYPDGYFDVIIANESFSHFREIEASLNEAYRVLKPGGNLLVRDGNNSLFLLGRIKRRRFWKRIEYGPVHPLWFRSTDIPLPFFDVRRKMILDRFPEIDLEKLNFLTKKTAGMFGDEIFEAIREYNEKGEITLQPKFLYRNPMTGEFPEKEINPFELKRKLIRMGFDVSFIPYFYSESVKNMELIIKRFYYFLGNYIPTLHLFLSPGFALLARKNLR